MKKNTGERSTFLPLRPALAKWTSVLLIKAADRLRHSFTSHLSPLEIHPKHYGILFLLDEQGPLSQAEIAQQVEVDRALMVQFIDRLEQLELVERMPNPSDRRSYAVTLTHKGQEFLKQATELARTAESEFLAPLSPEERQQLHDLLTRLLL
ncbi:MarR family winged helix-turn-helix transcriptional regulator [Chroococcidiopsis sp. CCALA 051]|uniref:MarR family winged helix-turn-helix transcriptional regulator n=1 Tax=Chroococcidiopsis sp. CCALA 051 TaxID=869949 RepID=UPI0013049DC4|nr:MarR family transcriptional regulator [Chroococcidiopsis sp. CCALA 051]